MNMSMNLVTGMSILGELSCSICNILMSSTSSDAPKNTNKSAKSMSLLDHCMTEITSKILEHFKNT